MPIYEYLCDNCGHELEALQKVTEAPLSDCPECQQSALQRKISAPAFRLKGSGWYETDFKSGNKRNLADGGGGESKSESKSEAASSSHSCGTGACGACA
ncbi:MAG TPA: FmdB family zinc ribbon protein [Candidatus Competibacteraceae bacterium]|nr:FmdB family zinc ribbon protein [Candidatus Competibacteraceae bacterium]